MAINKVVYGNNTLIDLTNDTVEASNLLEGVTAHDRSGTPVNGTAKQGHNIKDGDGTTMPTQPNLQFADANVSNDGTNNATVVRNFVDINWDDWQEVDDNDDTYYRVTDAPLVDGNVEIDLMTKLWENPAPTASFSAQTITLNSADYDFLLVIALISASGSAVNQFSTISKKGAPGLLNYTWSDASSRIRKFTYTSDTQITFSDATINDTTNNVAIIPVAIYGIKQKVSISLSAIISNVSTSASKCMLSDGETSVEDALNYSTEEHIVGKWIDGSVLYEKTVDFGALPNNTTKTLNHGISNVKNIVDVRGSAISSTNTVNIPHASPSNLTYAIQIVVDHTSIAISVSIDWSSFKGYITLRYTKTS